MADLIFSRDGVLRMRVSAYDRVSKKRLGRLVPLRAWEAGVDEHAFLKSLHSAISFEDGLSVGEMMENLAPWAEMMTGVACMDFPAFLEEARRGGKRVEDIDDPLMQQIRYLDKLVDEVARGKKMEKVLRS